MKKSADAAVNFERMMMARENAKIVIGKRYKEIDGLRAVAVFMVIWCHAAELARSISSPGFLTDQYTHLMALGSSGVSLFFVISGFLITGIIIDTKDQKHKYKNFYIRRALRIWPLYYLGIAFIILLMQFFPHKGGAYDLPSVLSYHILFISNWVPFFDHNNFATLYTDLTWFSHLWSLAVEQQFYLLWPVAFLFMYRKASPGKLLIFLGGLIVLVVILRAVMAYSWSWLPVFTGTLTRMDALFMGAALSITLHSYPSGTERIHRQCTIILPLLGFILLATMFLIAGNDAYFLMLCAIIVPVTAVMYFFLVNAMIVPDRWKPIRKILNKPFFQQCGEISYGLYIYGTPVQLLLAKLLFQNGITGYWLNHGIILCLGFLLTYILAAASYRFVEKPIMRLKDNLAPYEKQHVST